MKERILHFIWQHQYFSIAKARTTEDLLIQVLKPGLYNTNAGPDFEQVRLKINEIEWNGDVEIHSKSSDWSAHNHHLDEAYNKVILHVVWNNDNVVYRKDGTTLPTLELKGIVEANLIDRVYGLIENINPIPCSTQFNSVPKFTVLETVHRALTKRLERKASVVLYELEETKGDWSEVAYRLLMKQMGMKINGKSFYELSKAVPYQLIRKYHHNQFTVEALLFGASGLLAVAKEDSYSKELKKEFTFLSHKHKLTTMLSPEQWKFMRLRPSNFPTVRLAQVASMLSTSEGIFEWFSDFVDVKDITYRFKVKSSDYWQSHYRFGVEARQKVPSFGKSSIDLVLLNVLTPLLAAYSVHVADNVYMDKAIFIMESLKPENNRILREWKELGVLPKNGAESQGLIELYNEHCQKKDCLTCGIGYKVLKSNL